MSVACAGEGMSSNYDQLQLLGKGAFGDVFLAAHKTTKIRCDYAHELCPAPARLLFLIKKPTCKRSDYLILRSQHT